MTEIGRHVGLRSTQSIHDILTALENLGLIRRTRKWRGIEIVK